MTDFTLDREIRAVCAHLTSGIRDKSEKADAAKEYEDHIRDAMQRYLLDGMTEQAAFSQVCEDLGDIGEIAEMLGEVHNSSALDADVRREYAVRRTVLLVVCALVILLLYCVWDIFVIQLLLLIAGIWAILRTMVYLRALYKRHRAVHMLRRYAKEFGYTIRVQKGVYTSLWRQTQTPAVVMENEGQYYKIRFLATLQKNRVLHFLGRNVYTVAAQSGALMLSASFGVGYHSAGWMRFLPEKKVVEVSEELPVGAVALPTLECRNDPKDKTVEEVLIFNPAPMRVFYREGNTETELLGGECRDDVWLHDLSSFRGMLERNRSIGALL